MSNQGKPIVCNGVRPDWLPDDVVIQDVDPEYKDNQLAPRPAINWGWSVVKGFSLEVPKYDFVYKALDKGFIPYFNTGEPNDWDGGEVLWDAPEGYTCIGKKQRDHPWVSTAFDGFYSIIGYNKKEQSVTNEKPSYEPAQKIAKWLSSEDVLALIRNADIDKAAKWDLSEAVRELMEKA